MADFDELEFAMAEQIEALQLSQFIDDSDFAFRLQLEEAMAASFSLSLLPSSSSSSHELPESSSKAVVHGDFDDVLREIEDEEIEKKMFRDGDHHHHHHQWRFHGDRKVVAREIRDFADDHWKVFEVPFERPFGEGSSSSSTDTSPNFRLYFKGMVDVEMVQGLEVTRNGNGVAICDPSGQILFQLGKPLAGGRMGRQVAEINALIEGLERALALGFKRITICCHRRPVYLYAKGFWQPKGAKVAKLMETVEQLQKRFEYCQPSLVAGRHTKFVFKLAKNAIALQKSRLTEEPERVANNSKETCRICLEERDRSEIFTIEGCRHRYCFSCMKQHVEAKLSNRNRMVPKCPHEKCKSELNVDSCAQFLTPKQIEIMKEWIREVSMPVTERVYCPYPKCSALMSKSAASDFSRNENVQERALGARKCIKCHGLFCNNCKVPWHKNTTCKEYKRLNPNPQPEDVKLKSLASNSLWRQCVKCNHMIELAEGCYHMTCRCGHEFCYNCGAEWRHKKATCSCPLWTEVNIVFDGFEFDEEDDDDDYDDDYDYDNLPFGWYF